jgi:hypothetical protein
MQPGSPDKTCLGHVVLCGDGVERNITARCHSLHSVVQHIQISDPLAPFAAIQMLSAQIGQEECVTQPLCAAHVSPLNRHPPGRRCTHTTRTLDKTPRPLGPHTISITTASTPIMWDTMEHSPTEVHPLRQILRSKSARLTRIQV